MKNYGSSRLGVAALAVCGLLAASALTPALLAKDSVPYRGAGWGTPLELIVEWPSEDNPSGSAIGMAEEYGEATHFGQYKSLFGLDGYFVWEDDVLVLIWTGAFYQEAADGSSVTGHLEGREPLIGYPTPFTMTITIVDGTGRFEGATGCWDVSALSTGDYTCTAEGWISSVGSTRSKRCSETEQPRTKHSRQNAASEEDSLHLILAMPGAGYVLEGMITTFGTTKP